ncbi:hypothetical protein RHS03_07575, partial [Rhizoctonia solani]
MSLSAGVYRIKNVDSGTYLVLPSSAKDTVIVCAAAPATDKKSLWRLVPSGTKFKLKNLEFNQECTIQGTTYAVAAASGYEWNFLSAGGGAHYIDSGINGVVIQKQKSSDKAELGAVTGANHQKWVFETAKDPESGSGGGGGGEGGGGGGGGGGEVEPYDPREDALHVPEGTYVIENVQSGTVIDLERMIPGDNVKIFGFGSNGGANQKWEVKRSGVAPAVTLRCVATSKYAAFSTLKSGTELRSASTAQEYFIIPADKGYYITTVKKPGYVYELTEGSSKDETPIKLVINYGQDRQKWLFKRI